MPLSVGLPRLAINKHSAFWSSDFTSRVISHGKRTSGRLASVGADGQIAVYTEKDGAWHVVCTLNGAHGVYEVNCVTWCIMATDEEVLATCGDDGHVNIWRVGG